MIQQKIVFDIEAKAVHLPYKALDGLLGGVQGHIFPRCKGAPQKLLAQGALTCGGLTFDQHQGMEGDPTTKTSVNLDAARRDNTGWLIPLDGTGHRCKIP